jgi:hypothetical protein
MGNWPCCATAVLWSMLSDSNHPAYLSIHYLSLVTYIGYIGNQTNKQFLSTCHLHCIHLYTPPPSVLGCSGSLAWNIPVPGTVHSIIHLKAEHAAWRAHEWKNARSGMNNSRKSLSQPTWISYCALECIVGNCKCMLQPNDADESKQIWIHLSNPVCRTYPESLPYCQHMISMTPKLPGAPCQLQNCIGGLGWKTAFLGCKSYCYCHQFRNACASVAEDYMSWLCVMAGVLCRFESLLDKCTWDRDWILNVQCTLLWSMQRWNISLDFWSRWIRFKSMKITHESKLLGLDL